MSALIARLPGSSKTEAIERAIETYLARDAAERLREIAGSIEIEDVSAELRSRDRST